MTKVSIIIRTKNEEEWIGHCLHSIFKQEFQNFEIILVDNNSTDNTLNIASRYRIEKKLIINEFFPGRAINLGVENSTGEFIVCISAHCIPKDKNWLSNLIENFDDNKVAGVYGRQLPLSFTDPIDKRDLINTFGLDKKVQIKDYFFHNANSMIRRDVWEKIPFDENVTNIEDRVWAKSVIRNGYKLIYEPDAGVYHYHGLHQGNPKKRVSGVVSIIDTLENGQIDDLPETLRPENIKTAAIIPLTETIRSSKDELTLLTKLIEKLKSSNTVSKIYLLDENDEISKINQVYFIKRSADISQDKVPLEIALNFCLLKIEEENFYPDKILYLNYDYLFRPEKLFDDLSVKCAYGGYETIFPAFEDFGNLWLKNEQDGFDPISRSLESRKSKNPIYRALYGQGCLTNASLLRKKKLIGTKVGIISLTNMKYTLRLNEEGAKEILNN